MTNPLDLLRTFAGALEGKPAAARAKAMRGLQTQFVDAANRSGILAHGWETEDKVLGRPASRSSAGHQELPTFPGDSGALRHLAKFVSKKGKRVPTRTASLATIYFLGASTPKDITSALESAGYGFGKGKRGNLVRSALWFSRAKHKELTGGDDGRQDFVNPEVRKQFGVKEGLE